MDKSEIYIKKCDHPLIQDGWEISKGDYVSSRRIDFIGIIDNPTSRSKWIWLPRQCQLQGMIKQPDDFIGCWPLVLNERISEWAEGRGFVLWGFSYEQLLLSFVMHELHQLEWDGNKWEKVGGITQ